MVKHRPYVAGSILLIAGGVTGIEMVRAVAEDLARGWQPGSTMVHAVQGVAMLLIAWTGLSTLMTGRSQVGRWPLITACLLIIAVGVVLRVAGPG